MHIGMGAIVVLAAVAMVAPGAWGHPGHVTPSFEERRAAMEMWATSHGMNLGALSRPVPTPTSPAASSRSLLQAVPKANCGPGDLPETALQGQVPWPDRQSGRAAQGYSCNLEVVSRYQDHGFANLDSYKNCAYYTDNEGGWAIEGAGVVLDVSNPRRPVETARLTARAMGNGGESLRVNQARGLLVSDHYNHATEDEEVTRSLAVYDVSEDCRHPELLADVLMPTAVGHEGCFAPDGMVYYMADGSSMITPIDLSDPRQPKQLSEPWALGIHGCSISDDGNRGYFARTAVTGPGGAMLVVDTSQANARLSGAAPRGIATFETPDGGWQQGTIPLTYAGRPYVLDWPELQMGFVGGSAKECADTNPANFAYPRIIDVGDESKPREVSKLLKEVDLPEHCAAVAGDYTNHTIGIDRGDHFWQLVSRLFVYDSHYCRTDRLHEPTIVACVEFASGLRVFDIRDPRRPREIAYYNPGTASATDPTVDFVLSPPVIRRDRGEIWMVSLLKGFHVLKFRDGVWPFAAADPCPGGYDYAADQYDLEYRACLARRQVTPAPAVDALVSLPANRRCRRRRTLQIRLAHPTEGAITIVRVWVNGKRVRVKSRSNVITLRRLPRRYTVRVRVQTSTGKTVTRTRRYTSCPGTTRRRGT